MYASLANFCIAILAEGSNPDLMRIENVLSAVSERSEDHLIVMTKLEGTSTVLFYK
jgi:hypothetical protein